MGQLPPFKVVRQPVTFDVADWDGSPCAEGHPKARPLAFSGALPEWKGEFAKGVKLRLPEKPEELLADAGIDAEHIVAAARELVAARVPG